MWETYLYAFDVNAYIGMRVFFESIYRLEDSDLKIRQSY